MKSILLEWAKKKKISKINQLMNHLNIEKIPHMIRMVAFTTNDDDINSLRSINSFKLSNVRTNIVINCADAIRK